MGRVILESHVDADGDLAETRAATIIDHHCATECRRRSVICFACPRRRNDVEPIRRAIHSVPRRLDRGWCRAVHGGVDYPAGFCSCDSGTDTARRSDLHALETELIARRRDFEEAINSDFGHRSRHETAMMEIVGVVQGIEYLRRNLRRFMRPTPRHIDLLLRFGSNHVEYQPLGVVGVISPWNYPVNLSLMPSSPRSPPATASCSSRRS
jgi:aldehyde dehydrogenase family protein